MQPNIKTEARSKKRKAMESAPTYSPGQSREARDRVGVVTISRPAKDVLSYLSRFSNFTNFMEDVVDVQEEGWTVDIGGKRDFLQLEKLDQEAPNKLAWRLSHSDGSAEEFYISVYSDAHADECVVTLKVGSQTQKSRIKGILDIFMNKRSHNRATVTLRRLKALLETGEIPTIQGQPSGRETHKH